MSPIRRNTLFVLTLFTGCVLLAAAGAEPQRHRRHRRSHRQAHKFQRMLRHALGHHAEYVMYEVDGKPFVMIKQKDERSIGLFTADYSDAEGYRGITNSLVMLDLEGKVQEVKVVDSEDTPPYVRRIVRKGFLDGFKALIPGETPDVDAITGATITCDAIRQSVVETLEAFGDIAAEVDFTSPEPQAKSEGTIIKRIE